MILYKQFVLTHVIFDLIKSTSYTIVLSLHQMQSIIPLSKNKQPHANAWGCSFINCILLDVLPLKAKVCFKFFRHSPFRIGDGKPVVV